MTSRYTLTSADRDGETASFSLRGVTLTSGNIVSEVAKMAAIKAAVEDVSLLVTTKEAVVAIENEYDTPLPTDAWAQRGIKFLVRGKDTLGNPQTLHISGANLNLSGLMSGEKVDLDSTEGDALKTALDAFWVSNAGNAVTVQEIVYVD